MPSRCSHHLHKDSMPRRACLPCTPNPPGRTCLPSLLYATLYDSNALAYPAPHPTRSRMHSLVQNCKLAQELLAYPVAPAPPPLGRSLLPTLPTAATKTCKGPARPCPRTLRRSTLPRACATHSHRAFCRLAAGTADPLCPARPRPQGTVVQTREMLNLTKSPSCPCLPCTFPPARRFRPLGLWQPSLGGTPQ